MATHTTKYNIGDNVFYIEKREGVYRIYFGTIKQINIGGKAHSEYSLGSYTTRGRVDLWETFEEAKKIALERQVEANKHALERIKEIKEPMMLKEGEIF